MPPQLLIARSFKIERPAFVAADGGRRAASEKAWRRDVDREFDADRDFGMHDPVGIGLAHSDAISKNRRRAHRFF